MTIITDTKQPSIRTITYEIEVSDEDLNHNFTFEETIILRPIAETLAMLDGNAFFNLHSDIYKSYLPEAKALFDSNGGLNGWAGGASWIRDLEHESPAVEEAYKQYRTLKALSQGDEHAEN